MIRLHGNAADDLELKTKFGEYLCVLSGALGRFCSFLTGYLTREQMKYIHSKLVS